MNQKISCCKNQYSVLKIYNSVLEHQPGVSYFPMIPFESVDPESRILLFYNSVREHLPKVSYFSPIPFGSINPESRIFLRFRSGASTRSLVFLFPFLQFRSGVSTGVSYISFIFYDSVWERQPRVSYFSYNSTREM